MVGGRARVRGARRWRGLAVVEACVVVVVRVQWGEGVGWSGGAVSPVACLPLPWVSRCGARRAAGGVGCHRASIVAGKHWVQRTKKQQARVATRFRRIAVAGGRERGGMAGRGGRRRASAVHSNLGLLRVVSPMGGRVSAGGEVGGGPLG